MDEITRTIPATLNYFMAWLRSYVQADKTAKRQGWRFQVGELHNFFHDGSQHKRATIQERGVPVVEVWATQKGDTCEVKLRCNESALAEWWEALRLAMLEKWPETTLYDSSVTGGLYGADRDLTFDEVCEIVRRCRAFTGRGGKVTEFYRREGLVSTEKGFYSLETLRGWLKDPKFKG